MSGVGLVDFEQVKREQKLYAKKFSEGNIYLERLLNDLYDNGIRTEACCGGHDELDKPNVNFGYVSIFIDEHSLPLINHIVSHFHNKLFFHYTIVDNNMKKNPTFSIYAINSTRFQADQLFIELDNILREQTKKPYTIVDPTIAASLEFIETYQTEQEEDFVMVSISRDDKVYGLDFNGFFSKREAHADAFDVPFTDNPAEKSTQYYKEFTSMEHLTQKINDFNRYIQEEKQTVKSR